MVYESDFYTTRRPYRPSASSYTASPLSSDVYYLSYPSTFLPYYYHYNIPTVTYTPKLSQAELIYRPTARTVTRLATYPEVPHHVVRVRVRPSVVLRELDRIAYRRRPDYAISAVDDFYRSESTKAFEDETRRIRADTASLMTRARSVVPRAKTVHPLDTIFSYSYGEPMPYRFSNDSYVTKLILPLKNVADTVRDTIKHMSYWNEPAKRFTGRGHLACVHYSGNKAFTNRRPLYKELSIRDDVNLLSFYAKNRLAAAGLAVEKAAVKLLPWRPSRKFQAPQMMEDPALELKAAKADREARFRSSTAEPVATPAADLAELKRKRQEEMRAAEEKALKEEAKREAERKAAAEREAAEKKRAEDEARKAEEAKRKAEEDARKAEEEARKAAEEALKAAENAKKAEEARKAEAKLAEEARIAEEARLAEEAKRAEEARLAEEERQAEQRRQEELARLEELEKQAQDDREDELARQAAELAEIARQESELAAQRLEELSRSGSAAETTAEADESEVPAEASPAEAEDQPEPVVEEPETPEAVVPEPTDEATEVSEDEAAEPDVTDEE